MLYLKRITFVLVFTCCVVGAACAQPEKTSQDVKARELASEEASPYKTGRPSRDGIGKFYMGREISRVMGYRGASWLERPEREVEEATDVLIRELPLTDSSYVADIGAGTGYFSFRVAARIPQGRVFAVDIQQEMLDIITRRKTQTGILNIEPVRGNEQSPNLETGSIDLVLMVDVYHEFALPYEMMTAIVEALKPGGIVALVEYRAEDPAVPIKPLHKMTEKQARAEMEAVGLRWVETRGNLPQQHLLIFHKPIN